MVLTGCGSQKNESAESEQTQEAVAGETTEEETESEKIEVSFEEMNYNAFLKNEAGEEVVGFHIPFGWSVDNQDDRYATIRRGYGNYVSISYLEDSADATVYQDLPESYLKVNDDGRYDEYYDSYDIEYIGECTCPYGTAYQYKATITATGETNENQHTFYDLIALVKYGNDIIYMSTSVTEIYDGENGAGILGETIQLLLDQSDSVQELPQDYEYYLENDGVKLLGYHMPEGWQFSKYGNETGTTMSIYKVGKSISVYPIYATDPSSLDYEYIEFFETGKELEPYDLGDMKIEYLTEEKDEENTSYGTIKIYDQVAHYIYSDGMESDIRNEIGMFKWNGQVFLISYSDANRDVEEGYEGALKELIQQLF